MALLAVAVAVALAGCAAALDLVDPNAPPATVPFPMVGIDPSGRSQSPHAVLGEPRALWNYTTPGGAQLQATPLVYADRVLVAGLETGLVTALDRATGAVLAEFQAPDRVWTGLAYGWDVGIVAVPCNDGNLYGLDATTLEQQWAYAASGRLLRPAIYLSERSAFLAVDQEATLLYVSAADGEEIWTYELFDEVSGGAPIVSMRHRIVIWVTFGSLGRVRANLLDESGRLEWIESFTGPIIGTPCLSVDEELVFVGTDVSRQLAALRGSDGEIVWQTNLPGSVGAPLALAVSTNVLVVGSLDSRTYGVSPGDGRTLFTIESGNWVQARPVIGAMGIALVGSVSGDLLAIDTRSGTLRWRFDTGGPVYASAALTEGVIFAASTSGTLHAFTGYFVSGFAPARIPLACWSETEQQRVPCVSSITVFGSFADTPTLACLIGAVRTAAQFVNETAIECALPPPQGGPTAISVAVTVGGEQSSLAPDYLRYYVAPAVSGMAPLSGPPGTEITVSSTEPGEFSALTRCRIGGKTAQTVFVNATTIVCRAPSPGPGPGALGPAVAVTISLDQINYVEIEGHGFVYTPPADPLVLSNPSPWPSFHGSHLMEERGVTSTEVSEDFALMWETDVPAPADLSVVVGDRLVYAMVGTVFLGLHRASGEIEFQIPVGALSQSAPLLVHDAVVYSHLGAVVYANALTGATIWSFERVDMDPVDVGYWAVADMLVVSSFNDGLYLLDAATGAFQWRTEYAAVSGFTALDTSGEGDWLLVIGSQDGLGAFDPATGQVRFEIALPQLVGAAPAVDNSAATLYSVCDDGIVRVFTVPEGGGAPAAGWTFDTGDIIVSSPVLYGDRLYVSSFVGVFALDRASGAQIFTFETGSFIASPPAVVGRGRLLIPSLDTILYLVDDEGELVSSANVFNDWIEASPAVDADGTVYVACYDRKIRAFSSAARGSVIFERPPPSASDNAGPLVPAPKLRVLPRFPFDTEDAVGRVLSLQATVSAVSAPLAERAPSGTLAVGFGVVEFAALRFEGVFGATYSVSFSVIDAAEFAPAQTLVAIGTCAELVPNSTPSVDGLACECLAGFGDVTGDGSCRALPDALTFTSAPPARYDNSGVLPSAVVLTVTNTQGAVGIEYSGVATLDFERVSDGVVVDSANAVIVEGIAVFTPDLGFQDEYGADYVVRASAALAQAGFSVPASEVSLETQTCPEVVGGSVEAGDGQSCVCPPGFQRAVPLVCTQCPSNTFKSVASNGLCSPCPALTQAPIGSDALDDCKCSSGAELSASNECVCSPGYAPVDGECSPCEPDSYKGTRGNEGCAACPSDTTTNALEGASSSDQCVCRGEYFTDNDGFCQTCPPNAVCNGSGRVSATPGFWTESEDASTLVYACPVADACTGTGCAAGYKGPLCAACLASHGRVGEQCLPCPPPWLSWLLVLAFVTVFVAMVHRLALSAVRSAEQGGQSSSAALKVLANYVQMIAILSSYRLNWSSVFVGLFQASQTASIDLEFAPLSCEVSDSFLDTFVMTVFVPVFVLVVGAAVYGVTAWRCGRGSQAARVAQTAIVIGLYYVHTAVAANTFKMYSCISVGDDEYLAVDTSVRCSSGSFRQAQRVGAATMLVYVFGAPLATAAAIFAAARRQQELPVWIAWFSQGFRPEYGFFELVVLLRKITLVLFPAIFANTPSRQLVGGIFVLLVSVPLQAWLRPFAAATVNQLEMASLACVQAVLLFGIMLFANPDDGALAVLLTILLIVLQGGLLATFAAVLYRPARTVALKYRRRMSSVLLRRPEISESSDGEL